MAEAVQEAAEKVKKLTVGGGEKKKKVSNKKNDQGTGSKDPLELSPPPEYISHRIEMFEKFRKQYDEEIAKRPRREIEVSLRDGSTRIATAWETTPLDIAREIGKSFSEKVVISKVNGDLWDLERPFEDAETVKLEFLTFDDAEGKKVFWHSSAHILGEASERHYGCHLCVGPPTDDGFFYEMALADNKVVTAADFAPLETIAKSAIKEKQPFVRLVLTKEQLLEMFAHNKYKQQLIQSKIPDGTSTTVYRCGPLIDLCRGPHVPNTGRIKAFRLLKNSASYFLGDAKNDSLQRVYGISFPDKKLLEAHMKFLQEAAARDHRKLGREQELFFFNELSPGSAFWLPHGARIYNALVELMRNEYWKRGFEEVITPNMYNVKLWETSGHWQNYQENMFSFDVEKDKFALKPMNCPGHCLIFKNRERSYRELPWRLADFGVLHRNEFSGALSGLTRVRRFQQDDAHIFCTHDQIGQEITASFDFLKHIYGIFGFTFKLELSTRPEKYLGKLETWQEAEQKLTDALNAWGGPWEINAGDGAFYGPKIDIQISDALGREFQCATIQLDFQLPEKFDLQYHAHSGTEEQQEDLYARPVMIHRAILGSVERMTAILIEHFAGKWPFWISPRQVLVIPVGVKYFDYAQQVRDTLHNKGQIFADVDLSGNTLQKKVRTGQLQQYNFIFIVGEQELNAGGVNVRNRDNQQHQEMVPLDEILPKLVALKESKKLENAV